MSTTPLILTPWITGDPPLTSPFGSLRNGVPHSGDDYAMPIGTLLRAPVGGVARSFVDDAGGLSVVCACNLPLPDGRRITSWGMAHLSEVSVGTGDTHVVAGQIVARSGNSGSHTSGPHLHFTLRVDGERVAPSQFLGRSVSVSGLSGLLLLAGAGASWLFFRGR